MPYRVLRPPPVWLANTAFAFPLAAEFVAETAGVTVVLVNVPTAAIAAVGIATAAKIATHTMVVSCLLVNGPQPPPAPEGFRRSRMQPCLPRGRTPHRESVSRRTGRRTRSTLRPG